MPTPEDEALDRNVADFEALAGQSTEETPAAPLRADDGVVDVPIPTEEDADDGGEDDAEQSRPGRKERRRNRYQEAQQAAEEARREVAELRGQLAEMRRAREEAPAYPPSAPAKSPLEQRADEILQRRVELSERYNSRVAQGGMTREEAADFQAKSVKLEADYIRAVAQASAPPQRSQNPLEVRYYDVAQHPQAVMWAEGELLRQKAEGKQDSLELRDAVVNMARRKFGIGSAGTSEDARRSRFASPPRGAAPAAAGNRRSVRMTPEMRVIAAAAYPRMSEEQAVQRWVQENGEEFLRSGGK